uniref:Calmodulin n=1 Tax=Pinguiococcus pyrenoidosus TaxID=172671 RepID=A0A7R9U851_9STRA|mmetsp:Transcript_17979/g.68151  ORF Transcript_17979/g.68151 Transcript_17979/m.68151 type:complete len:147 (+) Transcript_17979:60-500(+)
MRSLSVALALAALVACDAVLFASPGRTGARVERVEEGTCEVNFEVSSPSSVVDDEEHANQFNRKLRSALSNYWHLLDYDGDGFATQQEIFDFNVLRYSRLEASVDEKFYKRMRALAIRALQTEDKDCDGMLSEYEFLGPHMRQLYA